MASRFNTLYRGEAREAADALENVSGMVEKPAIEQADELRVALINALTRIAALEKKVYYTDAKP